jgi:hypothetical protein
MKYRKRQHYFLSTLSVCLISVEIANAQQPEAKSTDHTITPQYEVPVVVEAREPKWQLSVAAGGISKHLTTEYEPSEGYTERHRLLGLDISQAGPGWVFSAQAFYFNDSHDEDSFIASGAFGYRMILPLQLFVYGGVGLGYADTSYYSGALVLPLVEIGWWRISAQGTYLPKLPDADSGIGVQFKFKVFEW